MFIDQIGGRFASSIKTCATFTYRCGTRFLDRTRATDQKGDGVCVEFVWESLVRMVCLYFFGEYSCSNKTDCNRIWELFLTPTVHVLNER